MAKTILLSGPVTSNSRELENAVDALLRELSAQLVSEDADDITKSKLHEIQGEGVIYSMQTQPDILLDFIIIGPPEKRMRGFGMLTLAGFNEDSRYFSQLMSTIELRLKEYIAITARS